METRKTKNFLLNHACMYELISMDNSKYLVWKLMFPRSGDTFFTVDKSLDMCSWEKLYSILKRITLQYAVSPELPLSSISVECCDFWYRLTIEKVTMNVQCVHEFCGIDIEANLLHDEILCAKVYHSDEFAENSTAGEVSNGSSTTNATSISRKRTYSVTSLTHTDLTKRRTSMSFTPVTPSASHQTSTKSTPEKRINVSPSSGGGTHTNVTERRSSMSPTSTRRPSVSSQTATESTPERLMTICPTSNGSSMHADCSIESHDDNICLRYSEDEASESEETDSTEQSQNSSASSNITESTSNSSESEGKTVQTLKIRMDLVKLDELLKDPKYLNRFCYEKDGVSDRSHRTFNVYSVDDNTSYAAFYSPDMVKNIRNRSDCKLFLCYSAEMLHRFHNFTEMQFEGINGVLMVYVNHISDRVRPFGYIFLPNKTATVLDNVVKVIDEWLNPVGAPAMSVTKCVFPQDGALHQAIARTWPQAKLIGCSAEYQQDIKLFARRNKGLKSELTRVACFLCYLPEIYMTKGIELIQTGSPSEYAKKLAQYLQTKWIGRPISIYDENIVYRTLTVCNRFSIQMLRNRFRDASYREGEILKNCWDFIEFLRTESEMNFIKMSLDGTKMGSGWRTSFQLNTKMQKDRESLVVRIRQQFQTNLETMSQDEAVGLFLQQMVLYV